MVVAGGSLCHLCQWSLSQMFDLHPKVFNVGLENFTQFFHRWIGLKISGLGLVKFWFGIRMGNLDNWDSTTGTTLLVLSLSNRLKLQYTVMRWIPNIIHNFVL